MKLYVGNLSWGTDEDELRNAFGRFGNVSEVRVITDRDTGRSRGFGFVTFENAEDGEAAMAEMDGAELGGRPLKVNEAKERQPHGGGGHGGGHGGGRGRDRW